MINILLNGCNGRMGQVITKLSNEDSEIKITAGADICPDKIKNNYPVYHALTDVKEDADVIIDFSNIKALPLLLSYAVDKKKPVVICTTGQTARDKEHIADASEKTAILTSANMSLGINLLMNLVKTAASALQDSFDIEIIEMHHNQKADSPSGTALAIADAITKSISSPMEYVFGRHSKTQKRAKHEIGIHAIRGGNIIGEHSVLFAGMGEVIEIKHSAISRDVFGIGAIKAAKYLYNKKTGLYSMDDVINNR
ncbi:MAG: 4-hydroxy-tetrahydrodipicolinate reductase [Clostridiales bacterium]|nr:4-hydroxy-tetrahydrodipicolinate reductase [Clostridiales bacterium]